MSFCVKCGNQIPDEAKFCTNCGNPVSGSQVAAGSNQAAPYLLEIKDLTWGFITMPVTTASSRSLNLAVVTSVIVSVLLLLVNALLGMWFANQGVSSITEAINESMGGFVGALIGDMGREIPTGKLFVSEMVLAIIGLGWLFIGLYISNTIFNKDKREPMLIWNAVILAYGPYVIFKLLGTLLAFISAGLAFLIIIAGALIFFICLYAAYSKVTSLSSDMAVYCIAANLVIAFVFEMLYAKSAIGSLFNGIM